MVCWKIQYLKQWVSQLETSMASAGISKPAMFDDTRGQSRYEPLLTTINHYQPLFTIINRYQLSTIINH